MAIYQGNINKMEVHFGQPVQYQLLLGKDVISMNQLLGRDLSVRFSNEINCIHCGKPTKKSFGQGFCYPCFISAPEASECVLNPELCQAHLGITRDLEWSDNHCLTDHYVYLAISSGLKVGVTRASQVPTRWIDQGASRAIKLALTPNRYLAGSIEAELKKHMSDKTAWQKMLKNEIDTETVLENEKQKAWELLSAELQEYVVDDDEITNIDYPVLNYPLKVKSMTFDNVQSYSGKLTGIKGQYLIFEDSTVLNIRRHSGYKIELEI
jgi:hypothetical protein